MERGDILSQEHQMADENNPVKRTSESVSAVIFDMDNTLFDLIGAKITGL